MDETSFLETDSFLALPHLRLVSRDIQLRILGTTYLDLSDDGRKRLTGFELGKQRCF